MCNFIVITVQSEILHGDELNEVSYRVVRRIWREITFFAKHLLRFEEISISEFSRQFFCY